MQFYFLPLIIALGIITSFDDIKEGKVKNKYLISALLIGVAVHLFLFLQGVASLSNIFALIFTQVLVLIAGVSFWYIGLWAAGDAKLFFVFAFLLPSDSSLVNMNAINLIVNTFIPLILFLIVQVASRTTGKEKLHLLKDSLGINKIAKTLLIVFSLSWLVDFMLAPILQSVDIVLMVIMIRLIRKLIQRVVKSYLMHVIAIISIVRLVFDKFIWTAEFWLSFMLITGLYTVMFAILSNCGKYLAKNVKLRDLRIGMKIFDKLPGLKLSKKGLSLDEISKIRLLYKRGLINTKRLKADVSIPFAPYLFAGALMTMVAEDNILAFLYSLI